MQTIRLPRQLPPQSELLKLNRLLYAEAIRLDWSDVQASLVAPEQLDTLFRDLTLDIHIEYIDDYEHSTISEALSPLIEAAFARVENDIDATIARPIRTNSQALPPPALWSPLPTPEVENEAERTIIRQQHPDVKKWLDDSTRVLAETLRNDTINIYRPSPRFIPVYEIPCADIPVMTQSSLDMSKLSYAEMPQLPALLRPLVTAYTGWIEEQLGSQTQEARTTIQNYRMTLDRIQKGISLISTNQNAAQVFAFMNRVMWLQRIHTLWVQEKYRYKLRTLSDINREVSNHSWHPLQLAFILLNIAALIDARYTDLNATKGALADLRWFPTGEWKMEAYLGLTAYTLGLRCLQSLAEGRSGMSGTGVILRYTACQSMQIQHIAALLCACETIRRADGTMWGTTPFRLGLQPDPIEKRIVDLAHGAAGISDPGLLAYCPWCGSAIETSQEEIVESQRGRTLIYCRDPKNACTFCRPKSPGEGLPILVTDNHIHHLKPALLITIET